MENLKRRLEKFVSESPDIKRIYEESEAKKSYRFEVFKHELTNAHNFYITTRMLSIMIPAARNGA
jgi:hypothetical protein